MDPRSQHSHDHTHDHTHDHQEHGHGGHGHGHDHSVDFSNVNSSFIIAVIANLAFTILEAFYGFMTGSV
ncbi:MAG: cobalt-zinc-cadmium efflux system protein, partial [Candidatus Paceibacteria bacterium]